MREARRSRLRLRRRIRRYIFGGIVGFGGLLIIVSLILPDALSNLGGNTATSFDQGVRVAIQANQAVEPGQEHPAYSTSPPTSGWYYDIPLEEIRWGPLSEPVENEAQVSYLRRGAIMVQYNCPEGCPGLQEDLRMVVNRYPEGVIMAPYPDMSGRIALTAWGWIDTDTFQNFDDFRIDDFIQKHIGRGPESFR